MYIKYIKFQRMDENYNRETIRSRCRLVAKTLRSLGDAIQRGSNLPYRSLSRQRNGAEFDDLEIWKQSVQPNVEPGQCSLGANHIQRTIRHSRSRRLFQRVWHHQRCDAESSGANFVLGSHGKTRVLSPR